MPSNGAKAATAKRKPGRGTKKNPWVDEDFVMTSDKSPLIDIDLVVRETRCACLKSIY